MRTSGSWRSCRAFLAAAIPVTACGIVAAAQNSPMRLPADAGTSQAVRVVLGLTVLGLMGLVKLLNLSLFSPPPAPASPAASRT